MELSIAVMWLIAGLVLAGADILLGSFYLLVMGAACLLVAAAAWCDLSFAWQLSIFAVALLVGGVAVRRLKTGSDQESQALQNADIGRRVQVAEWREDGTALVYYRGAQWTAEAEAKAQLKTGMHEIAAVRGSRLVLKNID